MGTRLIQAAVAVAVLAGPVAPAAKAAGPSASAPDKKARKKAKRYEKKAKKAYKKKRWDDAINAFELAFEQAPQPKYLFNIGRAYERKGDLFKAMEYVQAFARLAEDADEKEDAEELYQMLAKQLRKTSGEVKVTSTPAGALATLTGKGGEVSGKTPLHRWLKAGAYRIELAKEGFGVHEGEVVVDIGGTVEREIALKTLEELAKEQEAAAAAAAAAKREAVATKAVDPATASPAASPRPAGGGPGVWAWTALGVGAAAVAGGVAFGLMSASAQDEVDGYGDKPLSGTWPELEEAQDAAESGALTANVLYGVGGALVATGAALVVFGGGDDAVVVGPGWLGLRGRM